MRCRPATGTCWRSCGIPARSRAARRDLMLLDALLAGTAAACFAGGVRGRAGPARSARVLPRVRRRARGPGDGLGGRRAVRLPARERATERIEISQGVAMGRPSALGARDRRRARPRLGRRRRSWHRRAAPLAPQISVQKTVRRSGAAARAPTPTMHHETRAAPSGNVRRATRHLPLEGKDAAGAPRASRLGARRRLTADSRDAGARLGAARGHSSAGRAPALQAGGRRFDPGWLHRD